MQRAFVLQKRFQIYKQCRIFGVWCKIRRQYASYEFFFAIFRNLSDTDIQHITKKMQVPCIFFGNAERGAELAPNKHQVGAGLPLQGVE